MEYWTQHKTQVLTSILILFYVIGVIGMFVAPTAFAPLTPFNLLLTAFILFVLHPEKDLLFFINLLFVFVGAWFLEMIGVTTGTIFGSYVYGNSLGPKLNQTPLIIGLNWVIVAYASLHVSNQIAIFLKIKMHEIVGALVSAFAMVFLDFFIEPVAAPLDFWNWDNQIIPIQNYTAWFFFGFAFSYWMRKGGMLKPNAMAIRVYLAQLAFFILLNLFY